MEMFESKRVIVAQGQRVKELFVFRSGVSTVIKTIDVAHPDNENVTNPMLTAMMPHATQSEHVSPELLMAHVRAPLPMRIRCMHFENLR